MTNTEQNVIPGQFSGNLEEQGPRMPKISPKTYEALNAIDGYLGKAPLARGEHQHAISCLQFLTKLCEDSELAAKEQVAKIASLSAELKSLKEGNNEGPKMVTEALDSIKPKR